MFIKQFFNNQYSDIDFSQDMLSNFYEKYIYPYTWDDDTLITFILDHFGVLRFLNIQRFAKSTAMKINFSFFRTLSKTYTQITPLISLASKLEDYRKIVIK